MAAIGSLARETRHGLRRILNKEDISVMLVVTVFGIVSFNKKPNKLQSYQREVLSLDLLWLGYFMSTNTAMFNGSLYFGKTIIGLILLQMHLLLLLGGA